MPTESPAITPPGAEPPPELSFYVAATEPTTRSRRTMKQDDCFLVFDSHGDIGASPGGPDGLFNRDTRYLSHFELLINGLQPLLLGSNLSDDSCVLSVDLTNPDIYYDNRIILQKNLLHVARTVFVWRSTLFHRFAVRNFSAEPVQLLLSITFDNDFADVFEVRGSRRERRGVVRCRVEGDGADFDYVGLDGKKRRTHIVFEPTPTYLSPSLASFQLDLEPHKSVSLYSTISCDGDVPEPPPFLKSLRCAHRELKQMIRVGTEIETSNQVFNEVLRRATADLAILLTHTPQGLYPYAGIPWYSTTFGRDGLITAMQCLWLDPRMALAVLKRLAAYQATDYDPESDAEPGKILHEMRAGEMAALHEVPFGLYYGSVDSTPLFVVLAGRYVQTTGDLDALRSLWPAIDRALAWIDGPGDRDRDGFVEYFKATPRGLSNQGWKDFLRCRLPCRRPARQGADRARRGTGIRLCGQDARVLVRRSIGFCGEGAPTHCRSRALGGAFRGRLLVRGHRDLCNRSRWRQAAVPGRNIERGSGLVQRHCAQRPRRTDRATAHGAELLLRLGGADRGRRRGALQSDVLPQRLGVAP